MPLEPNKILGAILGAATFVFAINVVGDVIFARKPLEKPGFEVALPGAGTGALSKPAAGPAPIADRLRTADAAAGAKAAKVCAACHNFDAAGTNKVGPGLWGVVGRKPASHPGFTYSAGMTDFAGSHDAWTDEMLDAYLADPKKEVPGNKMAFAGLKKPDVRADVIAYLRTLSDSPAPLP